MQTATGAHWAGTDVVGRAAHAVVSGLPMGRRRSRVAPKSGAHARVARLRQRLGGGDSRKMVGGGVSRRYLHSTLLISSDLALHAHSARRTSRTRVTLVALVEWRARGPAVKSQGGSQGGGRSDGVAKLTFDSAEMALWPAVTRWRGDPEATPRLPRGYPEATPRLPRGSGARSRTGPDDAASALRETAKCGTASRWSLRLICIARRPGARRRLRIVPPTHTCTEPLFPEQHLCVCVHVRCVQRVGAIPERVRRGLSLPRMCDRCTRV
jgi:hypothetical protein